MAELIKFSRRQTQALAAAPVERREQYLAFSLGGETFAMDIRSIREVIQFGGITEVPLMPPFIRGVINLRGSVVPVIDLQARLGKPPAVPGKKTCIVIFHALRDGERVELGLLVDAVSAVVEIAAQQIEAPPAFGNAVRREFILGLGKVAGRFVIILDPEKALDVDDMAELVGQAQSEAAG